MSAPSKILYLPEGVLRQLEISTKDCLDRIERLFLAQPDNKVWWAPKANIVTPDGRYLMATLAAGDDEGVMVVKSLLLNDQNLSRGLPQINGLITVLNSETGLPLAIIDANWITAIRTACLSGMAARKLARAESKVAAFIGCGVQAHSHLKIYSDLFPLKKVNIFGRGKKNIESLCKLAQDLELESEIHQSPDSVFLGADLLTTTITFAVDMNPFLDASLVENGTFVSIVDLAVPWKKESFSNFDLIVIDDLKQEESLPVKLVPTEYVSGDLGLLVQEKIEGRTIETQKTAFIFRGHAAGDLGLASLAYRRAIDSGKGRSISDE